MFKIRTNAFVFNTKMGMKQKQVDEAVKKALLKAGYLVHSKAVSNISGHTGIRAVDTGRLMGSLSVAWISGKSSVNSPATASDAVEKPNEKNTVFVGTNVVYAARIEFGYTGPDSLGRTFNQRPKPYLRPAFNSSKEAIKRIIRKAVGDAL